MFVRIAYPNTLREMLDDVSTIAPHRFSSSPAVDVLEQEQAYVIVAEVPGFRKEDLKINLEQQVLTLSGERNDEQRSANVRLKLNEIGARSFSRSFRFGSDVDGENISARLENGILTVTVPKAASAKPRTISIQ